MNMLKRKEKYLSIYSVILVVVLMLSQINESTILLSVLFVGIALLLFNPVFILPVFIISSLGNTLFAYDGISISRIIGFLLIIACLMAQIRNRIPVKKIGFIFLLIFFIYTLISSAFSITGSFVSFIVFMQSLVVVFLLSQLRNINLYNLSWILIVSSVVAIVFFSFWFKENIIELGIQRLSVSEDSSINRLATMISQLIAILFTGFLIPGKNKLIKIILFSTILIGLILIIFTGTRSALIAIIVSIVIITLYFFKIHTKKVIIYLPLIILVGYLFINQFQELDIHVLKRFTVEEVQDDGGSGRIGVWKALVPKTFEDGLFFGFGFGAENAYDLAKQYGFSFSAHNLLIDMFIQMGLTGLILFFTYFFILAKKLLKSIDNPYILVPVMILLTGLINGIGETVFLEKFFWNGIALAWLYLNNLPNSLKMSKLTYTKEANEPV
jgi:O-antigen ligase